MNSKQQAERLATIRTAIALREHFAKPRGMRGDTADQVASFTIETTISHDVYAGLTDAEKRDAALTAYNNAWVMLGNLNSPFSESPPVDRSRATHNGRKETAIAVSAGVYGARGTALAIKAALVADLHSTGDTPVRILPRQYRDPMHLRWFETQQARAAIGELPLF